MALAAAAMPGCGPSPDDEGREGAGDAAATAGERTADTARARPTPEEETPGAGTATGGADTAGSEPSACEDTVPDPGEEETMEESLGSGATIHDVLERHRDGWMERPGVIGTGIGRCDGGPCLVIYLRERTDETEADLPECVEGYRVRLEETGTVTPRGGPAGGAPRPAG